MYDAFNHWIDYGVMDDALLICILQSGLFMVKDSNVRNYMLLDNIYELKKW